MNRKRHLTLLLLVLTMLVGLFASACCFDPYYYHHGRRGRGHYRYSLNLPSQDVLGIPAPDHALLAA